ncbi:MAG: hypothetical protein ABI833_10955 [Acidobacteriota bacterium]
MRLVPTCIVLSGLLLSTAACNQTENADERRAREEKADQAAHRAGENAYKAAAKAKELARQAAEEVRKAGREVHDGWEDAKHSDPNSDAQHRQK